MSDHLPNLRPRSLHRADLSRRMLTRALPLGFAAGAAGTTWLIASEKRDMSWAAAPSPAPDAAPYRALSRGGPWLNSAPLTPADLKGKVVLAYVWTYTCINSLRPLPYVRAWAEKYRDRGLVVVGVHSPEFSFEKELGRVRRAVAEQAVTYPVLLDNDLSVWTALGNSAWPAFYFFDARGIVRRQFLGEGSYDDLERLLQALLTEAAGPPVRDPIVEVRGDGAQAAPAWDDLESPETYVGYARARGFASAGGVRRNASARYDMPERLALNRWGLSGAWRVGPEAATLTAAPGAIDFRFHARDLHLVLAPAADGRAVPFRIRLDGAAPATDCGVDVDESGAGQVDAARMYQLVRQAGPIRDRTFTIEFLAPGASAYVFTFG